MSVVGFGSGGHRPLLQGSLCGTNFLRRIDCNDAAAERLGIRIMETTRCYQLAHGIAAWKLFNRVAKVIVSAFLSC